MNNLERMALEHAAAWRAYQRVRIVDGSDGRTYIVERISYGFISVRRSDFMQQESIWPHEARFADIDNLLSKSFMQVTA